MHDHTHGQDRTASIHIIGQVQAADYPEWIQRHARKLGLRDVTARLTNEGMDVRATGPDEMLNALALGCSLGPASILVDEIAVNYVSD